MSRTGAPALHNNMITWGDVESYAYAQGCLEVTGPAPLVVSTDGASSGRIRVKSGVSANVTLVNAKLEPLSAEECCPAILIEQDAKLHLTLKGVNTAKSGWGRAGIELDCAALTITAESTGSLVASSDFGAAIGSGIGAVGQPDRPDGRIVIEGGSIYALGGQGSAGIGCGACLQGETEPKGGFHVRIAGGSVRAQGGGRAAYDQVPDLAGYRSSRMLGAPHEELCVISPLPKDVCQPLKVVDVSHEHDGSLPWSEVEKGTYLAAGFNQDAPNHACIDVVYELTSPGSIAYRWKVSGKTPAGDEMFDRYWFLKGSDGTLLSGTDFLEESETYRTHCIEGLQPGTYHLTLGVFCLGQGGSVAVDLSPCA